MAFCANCGRGIADEAEFCPNCGHPNEARVVAGTPAATTATYPYAGFWRRFLARLVDGLLIGIPLSLLAGDGNGLGLLALVYEWLMLGLNNGRTLGKMALGIRIAHPDGSQISLGTAAVRTAMTIVSGLIFLLGYLWAAWDSEKRTWHDMVANTRAFKIG